MWQLAALLVGEAAGRETELHGSAFRELAGPPTRQRRKQQAGRRDLADRECTCQGGTPPPPKGRCPGVLRWHWPASSPLPLTREPSQRVWGAREWGALAREA